MAGEEEQRDDAGVYVVEVILQGFCYKNFRMVISRE